MRDNPVATDTKPASPLPVIELFKLVLEIGKINTSVYQFQIAIVAALVGWLVKDYSTGIERSIAYIAIATLEHFSIRLGVARVCEISFAFFFGNPFEKRGDCSPKLLNSARLHFA